jgi:glycosyltransferase involved in cell wall biosynthesis
MKILYSGTLDPFGTCYSRCYSLRELEPDVHGFDTDRELDLIGLGRVHRFVENHARMGPRLRRANQRLIDRCRELQPDLVWIDTGSWVFPSTLRTLSEQGCFLVHHITDALEARYWRVHVQRRLLRATLPCYDVLLTTNRDDHEALADRAKPRVLLTDLGYDHRRFDSTPLSDDLAKQWDDSIVFIGHYEPNTEAGILALIDAGLPVTVYGHDPWFASKNRARLGDRLRPRLGNDEYAWALKGARIGLCIVSVMNYNQTAARSFEIPGSGTFLLAVRTPQHLECYEEGKEAEFFGDHEELVRKARYYLEHPDEREAIARRGHERCVRSGYSWDAIMARDWAKIRALYDERGRS